MKRELLPHYEQVLRIAYAQRTPPFIMAIDCAKVAEEMGSYASNVDSICRSLATFGLVRISINNNLYLSSDGCDWVEGRC